MLLRLVAIEGRQWWAAHAAEFYNMCVATLCCTQAVSGHRASADSRH